MHLQWKVILLTVAFFNQEPPLFKLFLITWFHSPTTCNYVCALLISYSTHTNGYLFNVIYSRSIFFRTKCLKIIRQTSPTEQSMPSQGGQNAKVARLRFHREIVGWQQWSRYYSLCLLSRRPLEVHFFLGRGTFLSCGLRYPPPIGYKINTKETFLWIRFTSVQTDKQT